MKFLLDTDTCVFWLRGQNTVRDHINQNHFARIAELRLENWAVK